MVLEDLGLGGVEGKMATSRVPAPRRTRRQKDAASEPAPMANGEAEEGDPRVKYQLPDLDLRSTLGECIYNLPIYPSLDTLPGCTN